MPKSDASFRMDGAPGAAAYCWFCEYDLHLAGSSATCPECGRAAGNVQSRTGLALPSLRSLRQIRLGFAILVVATVIPIAGVFLQHAAIWLSQYYWSTMWEPGNPIGSAYRRAILFWVGAEYVGPTVEAAGWLWILRACHVAAPNLRNRFPHIPAVLAIGSAIGYQVDWYVSLHTISITIGVAIALRLLPGAFCYACAWLVYRQLQRTLGDLSPWKWLERAIASLLLARLLLVLLVPWVAVLVPQVAPAEFDAGQRALLLLTKATHPAVDPVAQVLRGTFGLILVASYWGLIRRLNTAERVMRTG